MAVEYRKSVVIKQANCNFASIDTAICTFTDKIDLQAVTPLIMSSYSLRNFEFYGEHIE